MPTSKNSIISTVKDYLVQNFFLDLSTITLNNDTSFLENSIFDSTGILEVITFLEETYSITIEDDEMIPENLDSLSNIETFVQKKIN